MRYKKLKIAISVLTVFLVLSLSRPILADYFSDKAALQPQSYSITSAALDYFDNAKSALSDYLSDLPAVVEGFSGAAKNLAFDASRQIASPLGNFFGAAKSAVLSTPQIIKEFVFPPSVNPAAPDTLDKEERAFQPPISVSQNQETPSPIEIPDNLQPTTYNLEKRISNLNSELNKIKQNLSAAKAGGLIVSAPATPERSDGGRATPVPVIERMTIEKIVSGVSAEEFNARITDLNSKINASSHAIALTNRINNISGATINNSTFTGTVHGLSLDYLALTGGTLTGSLTGASATFSGTLSVTGSTTFNGVEYKWPSSDGTANQALVTNAAGRLSWLTISGGGTSDWNQQTNYGALTLTASTTIPYWAKSPIYASSTLIVAGAVTLNSLGQGWLHTAGGNNILTSSTSPTVAYLTATSSTASVFPYASTTALTISGNSYLGTVSSGLWNGTLIGVPYGGTGWAAIQSGTIPYGNGSSALSTTTAGTAGNVLAFLNGVPTWTATSTLAEITGTLSVAKGGTGQTSFGQGWLNSDGTTLSASTSPTVAWLTATSTTATSTFAGGLAVETSGLVYDYSTGNVGIGRTNPTTKLHISQTGNLDDIALSVYDQTLASEEFQIKKVASSGYRILGRGFSTIAAADTAGFFLLTSGNTAQALLARGIYLDNVYGTPSATPGVIETGDEPLMFNPAGSEKMRITTSGNIGIGTTSPSTKLSVGGAAGDTTGHGYFTGGLGVGMLNTTAGTLNVLGQCVTGDTKLRRRRKRLGKTSDVEEPELDDGDNYIYDEVAIKDIQAGDEIASLDEKTGKIVWSRVNALMDMGVKPIYKITTASGKTIRTTGNHPYLVKTTHDDIINNPRQGWHLGLANSNPAGVRRHAQTGSKSVTNSDANDSSLLNSAFLALGSNNQGLSDVKTAVFIDYANIKAWAREKSLAFDLRALYLALKSAGAEKILFYYGTDLKNAGSLAFLNKMRQIGFEVVTKPVKYFRISLLNILKQGVNSRMLKKLSPGVQKVLLAEIEKLEKARVGLFVPKANFDVEMGLDAVLFAERFDNFVIFSGDSDLVSVIKYLKSKGKKVTIVSGKKYMAGELIKASDNFIRLEKLAIDINSLLGSLTENENKKTPDEPGKKSNFTIASGDFLSSARVWTKVAELREGQEIAAAKFGKTQSIEKSEAAWDKIIKIENLPDEQVYDIEIEGTRNFIGNDIVAHNTYLGGNIGIGTTSPYAKLSVEGSSALGNSALAGYFTATTSTASVFPYASTTAVTSSGSAYFATSGGSVGIGTAGPGYKLEIAGSPASTLVYAKNSGGSGGEIAIAGHTIESGAALDTAGYLGGYNSAPGWWGVKGTTRTGSAIVGSVLNSDSGWAGYFDSKVYIAGNIGIGTTSPYAKLSVEGSSALGNSALAGYFTATSTTATSTFAGKFAVGTSTPGASSLLTIGTSTPLLHIDNNSGFVGIRTAGPAYPLDVLGTGTGAIIARFNDVNSTGCTLATGGTISCSSDITLKKNIEEISGGLDKALGLHPILFNWKSEDDSLSTSKSLGFIAQEVELILPKLVSTEDGGIKQLNTIGMIPILTKAIQEQQEMIEGLKQAMASTTGLIASLPAMTSDAQSLRAPPQLFAWILEQFKNIGIAISNGAITAREFIADKITARKVVTEAFEMKDSVTGDTYCVRISEGEWSKFRGTCGDIPSGTSQIPNSNLQITDNNQESIINNQEEVIDNSGTATTTPQEIPEQITSSSTPDTAPATPEPSDGGQAASPLPSPSQGEGGEPGEVITSPAEPAETTPSQNTEPTLNP